MRSRLIFALFSFAIAVVTASGASLAQNLPGQSNSAAGVTVKATPRALTSGVWEFEITFDTHTQDLNDDVAKSASLTANGKTLAPVAWEGDPPGGHHRKGVLKFNAVEPRPQVIELAIARPGEPKPRLFRWRLE